MGKSKFAVSVAVLGGAMAPAFAAPVGSKGGDLTARELPPDTYNRGHFNTHELLGRDFEDLDDIAAREVLSKLHRRFFDDMQDLVGLKPPFNLDTTKPTSPYKYNNKNKNKSNKKKDGSDSSSDDETKARKKGPGNNLKRLGPAMFQKREYLEDLQERDYFEDLQDRQYSDDLQKREQFNDLQKRGYTPKDEDPQKRTHQELQRREYPNDLQKRAGYSDDLQEREYLEELQERQSLEDLQEREVREGLQGRGYLERPERREIDKLD